MNTIFPFLEDLKHNNNREWFAENKNQYDAAKAEADSIFDAIYDELLKVENLEPLKKYRIYRDIRFSKDKTPYKNHFSAHSGRVKPHQRGGIYIHFEKDNCFIGGGFWGPAPEDLLRIRHSIDYSNELEKIITDKSFVRTFGQLYGDELKTVPKGFSKDHERIALLRKKQFLLIKHFKDKEIDQPDFPHKIAEIYRQMLPFFYYMTEVLTTNENGESII